MLIEDGLIMISSIPPSIAESISLSSVSGSDEDRMIGQLNIDAILTRAS